MPDTSTREVLGFQAEVSQAPHLIYPLGLRVQGDFLRELVSNALDPAAPTSCGSRR